MCVKKWGKVLLFVFLLCQPVAKADSWRVLFCMDSSDNLSDMAFKSITEMMQAELGQSVECFIQIHAYYDIALRYKVEEKGMQFIEQIKLTGNGKDDFINAAAWGFNDNTADHTMLILSNHGWGILDPRWNEATQKWVVDSDIVTNCCTVKRSQIIDHAQNHRGFMFNDGSRTYLTNNALIDGLDYVANQVLGKNIDIVAFDTCMGAMIEVAYQIAPYVNFMIGCQSCALKDGFEYKGIMDLLKTEDNDARDVAIGMVQTFDAYFNEHDDKGIYTNSAFDLQYVWNVGWAMDAVIRSVMNMPNALEILEEARKDSPRLCMWPIYTDMIQFFEMCQQYVQDSPEFDAALQELRNAHSRMIIAYCGGYSVQDFIHGSAIYCPFSRVDRSYYDTVFAQSSEWLNMLQSICAPCGLFSEDQDWTVGEL